MCDLSSAAKRARTGTLTRRSVLLWGAASVACSGGGSGDDSGRGGSAGGPTGPTGRDPNAVAVVPAGSYDAAVVNASMAQLFDLLGDVRGLVQGKTVTIKPNLVGYPFSRAAGRPPEETYITHGATVLALVNLLVRDGASRVRIVESFGSTDRFEDIIASANWDVQALQAAGVEFEDTRNMGLGNGYAQIAVPGTPALYTYFEVNRSYVDTDVFISLTKMKNHDIGGVSLSMKNLFGITPLSLYGDQTDLGERALGYRGPSMHDGNDGVNAPLPGEMPGGGNDRNARVPKIIVDQVAARPVDLAIVAAIGGLSGAEGPWSPDPVGATSPGLLIGGWNPVATDAVAMSIMGYDPLASDGTGPFPGLNHIAMAHARGLGVLAGHAADRRHQQRHQDCDDGEHDRGSRQARCLAELPQKHGVRTLKLGV